MIQRGRIIALPQHIDSLGNSEDKKADCYLATDCIGTEKLVSGEYNSDVFVFGNSDIRSYWLIYR